MQLFRPHQESRTFSPPRISNVASSLPVSVRFFFPALIVLSFSLAGCATQPTTEAESDCTAVIVADTEPHWTRDSVRLSVLQLIDEEMFNNLKQQQGEDLDASLNIVALGQSLGGYSNYEIFAKARAKELESFNLDFSNAQAEGYARQFLSSDGNKAYTSCRRANAQATHGIHLWIENVTAQDALVATMWTPPVGTQTSGALSGQVTGSPTPLSTLPTTWPPGEEKQFVFDRSNDRDFRLVLNMNGTTDDVLVPVVPILEKCRPAQTGMEQRIFRSREISVSPDKDMRFAEACVIAKDGWRFVPDSAEWMPLYDVMVRRGTSASYISPLSTGVTDQGFRVSEDGSQYCGFLNVMLAAKPTTQQWQLAGSFIVEATRPIIKPVCERVR